MLQHQKNYMTALIKRYIIWNDAWGLMKVTEYYFIYDRLSKRHKWHGYPVENLSNSIISNLLTYYSWSKRGEFPDAQLGILKQEDLSLLEGESSPSFDWVYSLSSNHPMESVIDKEYALQQCKDEFDKFSRQMKNAASPPISKDVRVKTEELYNNIEACLEKNNIWNDAHV